MISKLLTPRLTLAVTLPMLLTGCMTIMNGPNQWVAINSSPPGARATIQNGKTVATTPTQLQLSRRTGYTVLVEKEGFEPASAAFERRLERGIWFNFLWIYGAPIGFALDLLTGSAYKLTPPALDVILRPVGSAAPPPPPPEPLSAE